MDVERNILFGLAAWKAHRIDADQLAEAVREAMSARHRSVADILTERGWISVDERSTFEEIVRHEVEAPSGKSDLSTVDVAQAGHAHTNGGISSGSSTRDDPLDLRHVPELLDGGRDDPDGFGGRYVRRVFHAEGGIGIVWRVWDTVLGREVALKQLQPRRLADPQSVRRFLEEARITAMLNHPNIVPTHDLAEWSDRPYYTMRFLGGRTLKQEILDHHRGAPDREGRPPKGLPELLTAFLGVCNAIGYAHEHRVIHRDLKGANVMVDQFGQVVVLDWGLARRLDGPDDPLSRPATLDDGPNDYELTVDGQAVGTANYIPPEQAEGVRSKIGPHSDIFALGAILYTILTGRPPYAGDEILPLLQRAKRADFPRPSAIAPGVPPALERICLKAMSLSPKDRYHTASALAEEVDRWLRDEPVRAYPEGPKARSLRWGRKHPSAVVGAAVVLIAAIAGLSFAVWRDHAEAIRMEGQMALNVVAKQRAVDNLSSAVGVIGAMTKDVSALGRAKDPLIDQYRLDVSRDVAAFARSIAADNRGVPAIQAALGSILRESATVHECRYEFGESESLNREAIEAVAASHPEAEDFKSRDLITEYRLYLVRAFMARGDVKAAEAESAKAMDEARAHRKLAGRSRDAQNAVRTEVHALLMAGEVAYIGGHLDEAVRRNDEALLKIDELAILGPFGVSDSFLRALTQLHRGSALRAAKRPGEAQLAYRKAIEEIKIVLVAGPSEPDPRHVRALAMSLLGRLLAEDGKADEADPLLAEAIREAEALRDERPFLAMFKAAAIRTRLERAESRPGHSAEDFGVAYKMADRLVADAPGVHLLYLLHHRAARGLARLSTDEAEARRYGDQAEKSRRRATEMNPLSPDLVEPVYDHVTK